MSHLDEGVIHALLDGEIPSAELPPIQAHLGACAECRARLAGEQELLATSDRLIELIEVPAASVPAVLTRPAPVRRPWPRNLAWAATVVLAAGFGYSARGSMRVAPEEKAAEVKAAAPDTGFTRSEQPPALADGPQNAAKARQSSPPASAPRRTDERAKAAARDGARAVAADSLATAKSAAGASLAAATPPVSKVESSPAPPAAPAPMGQLNPVRRLGLEPNRLEETIVTSAQRAANSMAPSPITLPDAVRRLAGSLRLIEGLIPERLESLGPAVRVVYLTGFGELVLSQELENGRVRHTLIAPRGFPADSLARLRSRVRE